MTRYIHLAFVVGVGILFSAVGHVQLWPAAEVDVRSMCGADVRVHGASLDVTVKPDQPWSGVSLSMKKNVDLSSTSHVVTFAENVSDVPIKVVVHVKGMAGPNSFFFEEKEIPPQTNAAIRLPLTPHVLPIDFDLLGMRGLGTGEHEKLDVRRIGTVNVFSRRTTVPVRFRVLSVTAEGQGVASFLEKCGSLDEFLPFVDRFGQYRHAEWPGKTHSEDELLRAREEESRWLVDHETSPIVECDRFGGWAAGPRLKATGHFRTEKVNGKWWLVDPDGRLFYSQGIAGIICDAFTGVTGRERYFERLPGRHDSRFGRCWKWVRHGASSGYYNQIVPYDAFSFPTMNQMLKYGDDWSRATFGELAVRRLRAWGINTIGNWSDERVMLLRRVPYTDTFSTKARPIAGCSGDVANFPDVFAPEFAENADRVAAQRAAISGSDPWCIGWFVDNELHWGNDDKQLARAVLASPTDQPARMAFVRWLDEKGIKDLANVPSSMLKALTRLMADRYFETVRAAINKHAPNKLYLGCRFAWAGEEVWRSAASHCDVVSVNVYRKTPSRDLPSDCDDKPILVGEFHFGALDRGMFHTGQPKRTCRIL